MSAMTSTLPTKLPPGPRGLPVFGSLLEIRNDTHLAIDRLARRYGDICLMRFGSVPTVIISQPELLQEAFGKTVLADRWVSEIMDILSGQKDLVLAPYGEHWRQMQRFANRELLSARNIDTVRERYIERVVNGLVERMAEAGDSGEKVYPMTLTAQSNSNLMFRSLFGRDDDESAEFLEQPGQAAELHQLAFRHRHRNEHSGLHSLAAIPAQQWRQGGHEAGGNQCGSDYRPRRGGPEPPRRGPVGAPPAWWR